MINTFMLIIFLLFSKHKPWQRGNEWNSSWQVSHFSPWMLALQLHFPSSSHCSVKDPSPLQTQASQGGRFGQGWLWVSVSFFSEHILLLVLVALPQVAEQVLQSDQSPNDSPVTKINKYYISVCILFRLQYLYLYVSKWCLIQFPLHPLLPCTWSVV